MVAPCGPPHHMNPSVPKLNPKSDRTIDVHPYSCWTPGIRHQIGFVSSNSTGTQRFSLGVCEFCMSVNQTPFNFPNINDFGADLAEFTTFAQNRAPKPLPLSFCICHKGFAFSTFQMSAIVTPHKEAVIFHLLNVRYRDPLLGILNF